MKFQSDFYDFFKRWIFFIIFSLCLQHPLRARPYDSSFPYISGDTFRAYSNFQYDEGTTSFDPAQVKPGDVIFVNADRLRGFFEHKHPYIVSPYILLTHNSDWGIPGKFEHFLEDKTLVAWFGQNVELIHPKLHPLPIGLANRIWPHGNIDVFTRCLKEYKSNSNREYLVYMNINVGTYEKERIGVYNKFIKEDFVFDPGRKPYSEYLQDLSKSKFVLSPRGNGLDCHRTWETLYFGAIPIVISSPMDSIYKKLRVLIIHDWNEINKEFLEKKYNEMMSQQHITDKLFASFWLSKIDRYRRRAKKIALKWEKLNKT